MFWQVTVASTGPRLEVDREGGYLDREGKATGKESVFCTPRSNLGRYPSRLSRLAQCLDRFNVLAPKTYIFIFFYLITLRQGL